MTFSEITTEKTAKGAWIAKTKVDSPLDCEISMKGTSAEDAREKLIKLLEEE